MSLSKPSYPAVYSAASDGSAAAQSNFFHLLRLQYAAMILIAALSAADRSSNIGKISISVLLIILMIVLGLGIVGRAEQSWYKNRAMAESIKTSAWRFAMCARPFDLANSEDEFRKYLLDVLRDSPLLADARALGASDKPQITEWMRALRQCTVEDRLKAYVSFRINDQQSWYAEKARYNRTMYGVLILAGLVAYVMAAVALFSRELYLPTWVNLSFDPILALSISLLGWMQIRRHAELASSYNLTAHEIGIIKSAVNQVKGELQLSEFINEAELAFSREHTKWVARRELV